jgi:hypothetical protein
VKREPLFKILLRLRKMTLAEQTMYLIACIKCEAEDSSRRRELMHLLVDVRTRQIRLEMRRLA